MEFKEFENPEQKDYDIKVGNKVPASTPVTNVDNSLNSDEGIDLNALAEQDIDELSLEELYEIKAGMPKGSFEINAKGEVIRKSSENLGEDLNADEPKGILK